MTRTGRTMTGWASIVLLVGGLAASGCHQGAQEPPSVHLEQEIPKPMARTEPEPPPPAWRPSVCCCATAITRARPPGTLPRSWS